MFESTKQVVEDPTHDPKVALYVHYQHLQVLTNKPKACVCHEQIAQLNILYKVFVIPSLENYTQDLGNLQSNSPHRLNLLWSCTLHIMPHNFMHQGLGKSQSHPQVLALQVKAYMNGMTIKDIFQFVDDSSMGTISKLVVITS